MPQIFLTPIAEGQYLALKKNPALEKAFKAVRGAIEKMGVNLKHPSLNTHKFESLKGPDGEEVFEAYAQNKTPGAYRIFWIYGPGRDIVTIVGITPHP